ncbi:MAG: flagellar biosynthetic protein FliO [Alphaproteobacteria bacterium]
MDVETYIQFLLALVFVLALIGVLAWLTRRFGFGLIPAAPGRSRRRLSVVETKSIDAKRRLVLIRRDNREHLVLLGPNSETVVESGIGVDAEGHLAPSDATGSAAPSGAEAPALATAKGGS